MLYMNCCAPLCLYFVIYLHLSDNFVYSVVNTSGLVSLPLKTQFLWVAKGVWQPGRGIYNPRGLLAVLGLHGTVDNFAEERRFVVF